MKAWHLAAIALLAIVGCSSDASDDAANTGSTENSADADLTQVTLKVPGMT